MKYKQKIIAVTFCVVAASACCSTVLGQVTQTEVAPAYDAKNDGGWQLNSSVSDEFENGKLDVEKWHIQGTDGIYKSRFIGRAPAQFSTKNVRVEGGKLKLQTRWEPDFNFTDKIDRTWKKAKDGLKYENITSTAVIGKNSFLYGYMEIKAKAADAAITSAFWMTGGKTELDIFEHMGRASLPNKKKLETEIWSSIHDWSPTGKGKTTWTDRMQLGFRVADDFHVYGAEWTPDHLKFHVDGKLIRTVTRKQVGDEGWVITKPLNIWVDSECFPWHGIPKKEDLPVDYEIEYIRVWQKEGMLNAAANSAKASETKPVQAITTPSSRFLGFEGPATVGDKKVNWWIKQADRKNVSIVDEKPASGKKSLKLLFDAKPTKPVVAFAPYGSLKSDAGKYELSMKVWAAAGNTVGKINVVLEESWLALKPFEIKSGDQGKWVTLKRTFSRKIGSGSKDRIRILVKPGDVSGDKGELFVDDLSIKKLN
jgi:beta-glucanase (GH16 family)